MKIDPKKTLFYIWIAFSTLSSVLSFASLADSFLAWSPFIEEILASYRKLTEFFWGNLFSLFSLSFSQSIHDYLTINSLFSVSVTWGFYNTGIELGFALASIREFIKNNLINLNLEGNFFQNFSSKAELKLKEEFGEVPDSSQFAIQAATRGYSKLWPIIDGFLSSSFLVISFLMFSFIVPAFVRWRDMRWNEKLISMMQTRREDLFTIEIPTKERNILLELFDRYCTNGAENDREHLRLYHRIFRQSILWHVLAVVTMFSILVFANYFYIKIV